jgi:AcrR family transcriptional regulator
MTDPKLTPRKEPRQPRARATVDALVIAAEQLTRERGIDDWTTNHIADRAGASIGSLYQYFPSKESLLVALYLHRRAAYRAQLEAELATVAAGTPHDVASAIATAWFSDDAPRIDWPFDRALRTHLLAANCERKLIGADRDLAGLFAQRMVSRGWAAGGDAQARGALVLTTIERLLVPLVHDEPAWRTQPSLRATVIEMLAATLGPPRG